MEDFLQGCKQVAKALNVPPTSVLGGYIVLYCYASWNEPVLLWLTVTMPTGSGKSTLFRHLCNVLSEVCKTAGVLDNELALFLQLFNGHPWRQDTGKVITLSCVELW